MTLQRAAFAQWVRQDSVQAYAEAHAPGRLWPEVIAECQRVGMRNYTGFAGGPGGRLVVGYFETEDLDRVIRETAASEVNARWAATIVPLMESGGDISNGSMDFLRPVWHID